MTEAAEALAFNPFDPSFRADPYPHFHRLRRTSPVHRSPVGLWILSRHQDCAAVLRDPGFGHGDGTAENAFTSRERFRMPDGRNVRSFLGLDPPDHTRLRKLVSKAFTPRTVERLRPRIIALVDDLVETMAAQSAGDASVDLIEALAYPLPVIVISELLGVPAEDRTRFRAWSDELARGLDPDFLLSGEQAERRDRARLEFAEYFRHLAAERRRQPADDLLSGLVAVEESGDTLSEDELLATSILLLIAGHETTVNLIGNGALALLRHPDALAHLRAHPEGAAAAVEELLRYDPPVQLTVRLALRDAEVGGHRIGAGEPVLLLLGAANRDPDAFAEPDRLDLTRPTGRHLAFGLGIHFCLGAPLARLEGRVALQRLFQHDVALATDALSYKENLVLRGLSSLPVRISPVPAHP